MYQALIQARGPSKAYAVSDAADELLGRRVAGYNPALTSQFRGMDEATANAAKTARASAYQNAVRMGGMAPAGLRRAGQAADTENLANIAAGQLKQAQLAGEDRNTAMTQAIARGAQARGEQFQNLQAAGTNAAAMGDTTTQAALQDLFMGNAGQDYTATGRARMAEDARQAKANADWLRQQQSLYNGQVTPESSSEDWWKRGLKGGAGGAALGTAVMPGLGTAIGGGLGALAGIFS